MKIGNTVFFGAMAAILMSTGANAAVTQIASTEYVDSVVASKANASVVEALDATVSGLADDVETIAGAVNDINDTIGTGTMMVGGTPVDTIVNAINALDAKSVDAYTKAEADAAFATKSELDAKANTADLGALATMNTVGTDQIDNQSITADKLSEELANQINRETDLTGYVTETTLDEKGYATESWVEGKNYIPKPSPACTAASGTCVLTVNTSGEMEWMNVTAPMAE